MAQDTPKPLYKDEINMAKAQLISGLSPQRFRRLAIEGKVPSAQKNTQGFWKFSEKEVTEWAANRPRGRSSVDGRRMYKVRLSDEELSLLQGATDGTDIVFVLAYQPKPKSKQAPAKGN
jgi:hypothetical protein